MASNAVKEVELSEIKIDLASLKDLDVVFESAQSSIQNANKLVSQDLGDIANKWNQTFGKLKNELNSYDQNFMKAWDMIDILSKQLKDLGVTDTSMVDKYKGYLAGLNKTKAAISSAVIANKNRIDSKV
jgi:hypothetical protein